MSAGWRVVVNRKETGLNALTKAFVLLVTILAVVQVALVVPFVANTEDYKSALAQTRQDLAVANSTARARQNEIRAASERNSEEIIALRGKNSNLVSEVNDGEVKLRESQAQLDTMRADNARLKSEFSRLTAANQQQVQIMESLQVETRDRRAEQQDQNVRMIQLTDRNNDLQSQLDALTANLRRTREQLAEIQQQKAELEDTFAKLPPDIRSSVLAADDQITDQPFEAAADSLIRGQIARITMLDGEVLAKVNVGTVDGVTVNMKFLVYRDGRYLGNLIVTNVDDQAAAGRIELAQGEIRPGDGILSGGL